jgi:hypothetical protein
VRCETSTSPGFAFDNDFEFSFDTVRAWAGPAIRAVPFST